MQLYEKTAVDEKMSYLESGLSKFAAIPIAGTLAGLGKVLMGAGQTVTGLGIGIFSSIMALKSKDWSIAKHAWVHVKHGIGNMTAGTFEAIPFVGTGLYYCRKSKRNTLSDDFLNIHTGQETKWMAYPSLVGRDIKIIGRPDCGSATTYKANELFKRKMNTHIAEQKYVVPSIEKMKELAKEAIDETLKEVWME